MAFKYTLKTKPVMDGAEEVLTVRGLSLNDIVQLLLINRDAMEGLFEQFSGRNPESINETEIVSAGMGMVETAPGLVAHIVALAADATEHFDEIVNLPIGIQAAALEKIGELTFSAGGGPKKMLALAMKLVPKRQSVSLQP